jgi:HK97 family phage major capsid protein
MSENVAELVEDKAADVLEEAAAILNSVTVESEVTVRNLAKREIDVRMAPFGQTIQTITGPEVIEPGDHVADPSRLLLMGLEHEVHLGIGQDGRVIPTRRPTGKAIAVEQREDGAYATFRVAKTASGDEILALAEDGVIGGVSVEMGKNARRRTENRSGRRTTFVEFGDFRAVSPTYQPAYDAPIVAVRSQKEDAPVATEEKAPATGATNDEQKEQPRVTDVGAARSAQDLSVVQAMAERFDQSFEHVLDRFDKIEERARSQFSIPSAPITKPDDFSSGDWLKLVLQVMTGDHVDQGEIQARAAADLITTDNMGVVPTVYVGDVRETIEVSRPFLQTTRQLNKPTQGKQLSVPVIETRPTVGEQAEEKDELTSTPTAIGEANFNPVTLGGYGDISIQLLKMSDPSYLELYLDLLAEDYATKSDDKAVDVLLAADGINGEGTIDPEAVAFGTAWANAVSVSRRFAPTHIWMSSAAVAAFIDAKASGTNAPLYGNLEGNFSASGGSGGTISGLRPVHVPALDDEAVDVIVGPSRGFGWAENGTYTLQVDVPARAGRDVALVGILWFAPLYPAAFSTFAL